MDPHTLSLITIPIFTGAIGYVTNWTGVWMLFYPVRFRGVPVPGLAALASLAPRRVQQIPGLMGGGLGWQGIVPSRAAKMGSIAEPRRLGPLTVQGLFLRRQPEVAGVYADIIAGDVVTMSNIGEELLEGPSGDRTRLMIESALRPAIDAAVGRASQAVRVAVGSREYDAIRSSIATEVADYAVGPLADPDFSAAQRSSIRRLIVTRMRAMPPADFSETLRTAVREDEWLLYLHGAVLGFAAGLLHLATFG